MDNLLDYDDISIVPEKSSSIRHRRDCDCKVDGMYPIWTAPMSTVVGFENWKPFAKLGINTVIPRSENFSSRVSALFSYTEGVGSPFVAFSLEETSSIFFGDSFKKKLENFRRHVEDNQNCECGAKTIKLKVCIDIANGHMDSEIRTIKKIKEEWGDLVAVMGGNIANPETYELYEDAGADYVRVGIGGGAACITSSTTGVYYPLFSLMKDTYDVKKKIGGKCKIIADGGIKGYRDIQKALIYADGVMIGSLLNRAIESAGKTVYGQFYWKFKGFRILRPLKTLLKYGKTVKPSDYESVLKDVKSGKMTVFKEFYGMSTKKAQRVICESSGKEIKKLKTSEGKVMRQQVEYSLKGWMDNAIDYLRSAMSYTNSRTLNEYKESRWVRLNSIKFNN